MKILFYWKTSNFFCWHHFMHLVELWRKWFRLSPASNRINVKTKFWARKRIFCSNPPKNESEEFREQVFTRLSFDYGFEFALRYFHSSDCWRVRIFLWAFLKHIYCRVFSSSTTVCAIKLTLKKSAFVPIWPYNHKSRTFSHFNDRDWNSIPIFCNVFCTFKRTSTIQTFSCYV